MSATLKACKGVERRLQRRLGDSAGATADGTARMLNLGGLKSSARREHLERAVKGGQYALSMLAPRQYLRLLGSAPVRLTQDVKALEHLIEKLKAVEAIEIKPDTWVDALDTWMSLLVPLPTLRSQVGVATLEGIFADEHVASTLAAGKQFRTVAGPPPDELLRRMKDFLGQHMRKHGYRYARKLEREVALITRIRERQLQGVNLITVALLAVLTGVANLITGAMLNSWE